MGLFGRSRRPSNEAETKKLFFATDIHGSDKCFQKFINAGAFYGVQYIVLGGDITGKSLVPIQRTERGWSTRYLGRSFEDIGDDEKQRLEREIRGNGQYPVSGDRDELAALEDPAQLELRFTEEVLHSIRRWVEFAETRLQGTGVRCFVTPGNDDFWEIDDILSSSSIVEFVEGRCVQLDEDHEMITTGISNVTPWATPRELNEIELSSYLEGMFADVRDPANLVAVFHAPPHNSTLDQAPAIDSEFRVQGGAGGMKQASVGSTAVREFIELHQPLVGLHGHVHESRGAERIGRTLCINPGSEYTDGVLSGALITFGNGKVTHQLVAG